VAVFKFFYQLVPVKSKIGGHHTYLIDLWKIKAGILHKY
jgi:hypothetical protein